MGFCFGCLNLTFDYKVHQSFYNPFLSYVTKLCQFLIYKMNSVFLLSLNSSLRRSVKTSLKVKEFNLLCKYHSTSTQEELIGLDVLYPDIKGEPQPIPARPPKPGRRGSKINNVPELKHNKNVIIECKNAKFNHLRSQTYGKFDEIRLASKGWLHSKSKGDYFKINIFHENANQENVFWKEGSKTFADLNLEPNIVSALEKIGFTKPTNIQVDGIPKVLKSLNTVLAGETGCGKTFAYLLPIIQQILQWRPLCTERKFNTPLALVLTPSRELTEQIGDIAKKLGEELLFDAHVVVGGRTKKIIMNPSFFPMDLMIGSIGAISKLTTTGVLNMSCVRHVVLDEADTLLDDSFNEKLVYFLRKFPLGFNRPNMRKEAEKLPELCQLTLASATMPTSIADILRNVVDPDSLVKVETKKLHHVLTHVPQLFLRLGQSQKAGKLLEIIKKNVSKKIPTVIFSNRAATSDWISLFLNENGIHCVNLNGDMPSVIRVGKFKQFQDGEVDVLSSSDIGSRGLDTTRVKHVINYDFPNYMADYIHRCGRTGRIGSSDNCSITNFIAAHKEIELVNKIERSVRQMTTLPNVNGNITKIIQHKIINKYENSLID